MTDTKAEIVEVPFAHGSADWCWWCDEAIGGREKVFRMLNEDGEPQHMHEACVKGYRNREALAAQLATMRPLIEAFEKAQAALTEQENDGGQADPDYYYSRDDAGVELAREVPALVALLKEAGTD